MEFKIGQKAIFLGCRQRQEKKLCNGDWCFNAEGRPINKTVYDCVMLQDRIVEIAGELGIRGRTRAVLFNGMRIKVAEEALQSISPIEALAIECADE